MALSIDELLNDPLYAGISKDELFDYLSTTVYSDIDRRDLAKALNYRDPQDKRGMLNDTLVAIGQGALRVPSAVVGAADIIPSALGADRPFAHLAQKATDITGIDPSKLADEAERSYSPETQAQAEAVQAAWENPEVGPLDMAGVYLRNPSQIAKPILGSLPLMAAGGGIAGGLLRSGMIASPAIAAGAGEGVLSAGSAMSQISPEIDPQTAALYSAGIGLGVGGIGAASGAAAKALGIADPDILLATKGAEKVASSVLANTAARRIAAGAVQEGLIEEGGQSVVETVLQNAAEGKPLDTDLARNVTEGILAGSVMGGLANVAKARTVDDAIEAAGSAAVKPPPIEPTVPPGPTVEPQPTATAEPAMRPTVAPVAPILPPITGTIDNAIQAASAQVLSKPPTALSGELLGPEQAITPAQPIAGELTRDPLTGEVIRPLLPTPPTGLLPNAGIRPKQPGPFTPLAGSDTKRLTATTSQATIPRTTDTQPARTGGFTHEDRETNDRYRYLGKDEYMDEEGNVWNFDPGVLQEITPPITPAPAAPQPTETVTNERQKTDETNAKAEKERLLEPQIKPTETIPATSYLAGDRFTPDEIAQIEEKQGTKVDINRWAAGRFGADRVRGIDFNKPAPITPTETERLQKKLGNFYIRLSATDSSKGFVDAWNVVVAKLRDDSNDTFIKHLNAAIKYNRVNKKHAKIFEDFIRNESIGTTAVEPPRPEPTAVEPPRPEPTAVEPPRQELTVVESPRPEPTTPTVVEPTPRTTPSEQKKWLLREIDKAIPNAPETQQRVELSTDEFIRLGNERTALRSKLMELRKKYERKPTYELNRKIITVIDQLKEIETAGLDRVTFNVPGGGRFKITNTQEKLKEFRAKVEKSAGFRDEVKQIKAPTYKKSAPSTVIAEFLKDQEYDNAYYAALETNTPLGYVLIKYQNEAEKYVIPMLDYEPVDLFPSRPMFVARRIIPEKGTSDWQVIDSTTGMQVSSETTSDKAIAEAKNSLKRLEGRENPFRLADSSPVAKTQEQLLAQFKEEQGIIDRQAPEPPTPPTPPKNKREITSPYLKDKRFVMFMSDYEITINDRKFNAKEAFDHVENKISEYDAFINCVRG